jgi:hypothetical protein
MSIRKFPLIVSGVLVAALAGSSFVMSQEEQVPPPEQQQHFRAKQVIGSKVNLQGDALGGTVDDIVFDENGNVDYLIVVNGDNRLVTVPWDAARFNIDKRVAVVNIAPETFQQVPTYTANQYPAFATPAYRTQIYRAYGLTPGQQRRAMRRGALPR